MLRKVKTPAKPSGKRSVVKKAMSAKTKAKTKNISNRKKILNSKEILSKKFLNRETSLLEFNMRVLNEAVDDRTPLLERLRFCNIFVSNLDEFFMKRVGILKNQNPKPITFLSLDGKTPKKQLKMIRDMFVEQNKILAHTFQHKILPGLAKEKIKVVKWNELNDEEKVHLKQYFKQNIFPILTPLAVDVNSPFPFISNLSKSIGVCLRRPDEKKRLFARVKVPSVIPQWVKLTGNKLINYRFINIEEILMNNLTSLFYGMKIEGKMIFRVTRSFEIGPEALEHNPEEDVKEMVQEGLKERKFAPLVRLEYVPNADPWMLNFLKEELELEDDDLYEIQSIANFASFKEILEVDRPDLKYKPFKPREIADFADGADDKSNIFNMIRQKDFLVHFPYESYISTVERFIQTASVDPKVVAIKIILYRTDTVGTLIDDLIYAAENGKQVACIIELKARLDEERNIRWAFKLEEAGVHVTYGVAGHKTHAKIALAVRQESEGFKTYVNIGTGNFNSQTSILYTDLSYFTCKNEIAEEVLELFNFLTGRSLKNRYNNLLVAPFNMHQGFMHLIEREIYHQKHTKNGRIIAKMNSLEEPEIIEALYKASTAGVKIVLIVRGFCCLRPGVPGMSENIKVYSVIGRFLEHSRIFYFGHGSDNPLDGKYYVGSADWMHRNLFHRVETHTPIEDKDLRKKIWHVLDTMIQDNRHLWELNSEGKYTQRRHKDGESVINAQDQLVHEQTAPGGKIP